MYKKCYVFDVRGSVYAFGHDMEEAADRAYDKLEDGDFEIKSLDCCEVVEREE